MPEGHVFSGNPTEPIGLFLKAAPENFKRGVKEAEAETGRKVTCFMSDAFLWFVGNMAAEMDISWVPLWTAGPLALSAHVCTDELREKLGHNSESLRNYYSCCYYNCYYTCLWLSDENFIFLVNTGNLINAAN